MSITRSTGGLNLPAVPPPSPIPTGRGTRSAANEILIDYLEKSLNVPDLTLPGPWAFKVLDHGISDEELGFLVKEADLVFRVLEPTNVGSRRNHQQEIVWVLSGNDRMSLAGEFAGAERFRDFSEKMERVAGKLDAIAQELFKVLVENTGQQHFGKAVTVQGKESILSLFRYNHENETRSKPPFLDDENKKSSDHTLCLHFPTTQSQFSVQSDRGPLSFEAGPDTIVVTVGKHFGEWSQGSFESVSGEIICEPHLQDDQASFLIELKCLSSNLEIVTHRDYETISLRDQILIGLIIAFLYNACLMYRLGVGTHGLDFGRV
ncbi:2-OXOGLUTARATE (2OG) AND FE(II)-DEPENDENT OXYGENASE SUPERFAMILY PROTEIN [Salix koriyanagi]|uniref:2-OXOGLUTARATE (2OG) AND FE(II)-DEPENDENT OXYGENASE SUPERFAMILY PROTEIN n=1 Tax=Salix koriyanagi TaxID=2511006 RepID=A0A9Q0V057_9ROSI|nr:2-OXOGLUTARATE (2OG) AND FE(II)-DEPENDENT OXYGENASE SUPERFAMILY PROTEIN [Salix koriyanagi]